MNLIPKAATHTIVEVKKGSSYSFIVCNNVGTDNGMTYIAGAIMKKTMTLSRIVKYVDGYYKGAYSKENDFISSTAEKIKDQMIPVEFYKDLEKYGFDYKEWMAK